MYKIIHLLKVGMSQLSNHEIQCIESWKRVYPDFEIKIWTDDIIKEYAQDCEYARDNYEKKRFAYVIDYTRLKFLYEYGGIYMDTDVFCINRIPDSYFETTCITWDDKFGCHWSNNGCFTYVVKGDPIVKEWIERYQNLEYNPDAPWHNNWPIDLVLRDHGFNFEEDIVYGSLHDKDTGCGVKLLNRVQFGVNDYMFNWVVQEEGKTPYCQHCHALSWMGPYVSQTKLYYAVLDDETDLQKLSDRIDWWINLPEENYLNTLVIYVNGLGGFDARLSKRLLLKSPRNWVGGKKFWFIQPLGVGIEKKEMKKCVTDFLLRRFNNIVICKDIMKEPS